MTFEVPNLDAVNEPEELRELTRVFGQLHAYCQNKTQAMACRHLGRTSDAMAFEQVCDVLYDYLPVWARW